METAVEKAVEKVVENLADRIGRHVGYVWNYRSNILELTQPIEKLRYTRFRLQQLVNEANRQGDEIFPEVQKWLSRADEMIQETDKFIADERESAANGNRGSSHLKLRYQHSKKAKNQAVDIANEIKEGDKLIKKGVAHRPPPPGIPFPSVSGGPSEVFKSREAILDQIMAAFRDDGISRIGVWGMGGVGKTTLVQQLAKRAYEEKLFDCVVMALNISQTPDVKKIQKEIASILGLNLQDKDEKESAVSLSQSLKKHEKILVILDDIWGFISFETIGIPYGSNNHPKPNCKVLLTSREHDVLSKDMDTDKNFRVQYLHEEEAWSLFKKMAGDSVEEPELHPVAIEVVKKCEGLPVAIVTIATALKGESTGVWRNALEELRRCAPTNIRGVNENVYLCLELSYKYLKSPEAKSLFLHCGLLGDGDISMEDLLNYAMGLDLFGYMDSLEKARDKLVTLVKILKASSLLLDTVVGEDAQRFGELPSLYFMEDGNGHVRMHDVIRDVAKFIAAEEPHQFVVNKDVSLQEWEKRGAELRNCTAMSLKCRCVQELPEELVCPKLRFFLLDNNNDSLKIPDTFFKEMKEVRVLSLSRVHFTRLPSSLHFLSNLQALCLRKYWSNTSCLNDITVLGELKKLQILRLVGYLTIELPKEIMQLTDLRMLSLGYCYVFTTRNVISSLSRLEHLSVKDIGFYETEEEESRGMYAGVYELKRLSCLRSLEMEIPYPDVLGEDVLFENLTRYDICIGCGRKGSKDDRNTSRRLKLDRVKGPHLLKWFSRAFKIVESLQLRRLDDIKHFVNELDGHGFLQLKYLSLFSNNSVQYIMNSMEMERVDPTPTAFPLLEKLKLRDLDKLEAVCHGPIPMGCFANLRILRIYQCCSLKCILSSLPTTQGGESVLMFPQLRRLELEDLSGLIDFYSTRINGSEEPSIIPFFNQQVVLPKLEFLSLNTMDNVRRMWHSQHPVGSCSKLEKLVLRDCKILQTIFPSTFVEALQNLKWLQVDKCPSLKYLFPTSVVKGLIQLQFLDISDCGVEEIVGNQNGLDAVAIFLFPKLTSLKLRELRQLKRFYQGMYTLGCPLLKKLVVYNCDNVELHFQDRSLQGEVDKQPLFLVDKDTFPNMEELKLSLKDLMEIWRGQYSRELFGKLRSLEIKECHDISVAIPSSKLPALHNLEKLTLRSCNSMEEVIQVEGVVQGDEKVVLPQITTMCLQDLPMLIGVGPILQNLQFLEVTKCGLINLVSPLMAKRSVQLKKLSITSCSMVKEIVGDDDDDASEEATDHLVNLKSFSLASTNTFEFPSQEEMEVKELPRPTHLCKKIPKFDHINLQNLLELKISDCGNLEILLTLSMAKTLVQLKRLTVKECDKIKEIVLENGGRDQSMDDDEIIFSKLQDLELSLLPNLKSFCSARYTFRFPCLTNMRLMECSEMEFFCKGDSITPRLEGLRVNNYSSYWENDLNSTIQKMFMDTNSKEDLEERGFEEVPGEEDAEEGDSEEMHPNVEDSMEEEDTNEEDYSEGGMEPWGEDPQDEED